MEGRGRFLYHPKRRTDAAASSVSEAASGATAVTQVLIRPGNCKAFYASNGGVYRLSARNIRCLPLYHLIIACCFLGLLFYVVVLWRWRRQQKQHEQQHERGATPAPAAAPGAWQRLRNAFVAAAVSTGWTTRRGTPWLLRRFLGRHASDTGSPMLLELTGVDDANLRARSRKRRQSVFFRATAQHAIGAEAAPLVPPNLPASSSATAEPGLPPA